MGYAKCNSNNIILIMDIYIAWFLYRLFKKRKIPEIMFPTPIQNYSLKINIGYRVLPILLINLVITTNSCDVNIHQNFEDVLAGNYWTWPNETALVFKL